MQTSPETIHRRKFISRAHGGNEMMKNARVEQKLAMFNDKNMSCRIIIQYATPVSVSS